MKNIITILILTLSTTAFTKFDLKSKDAKITIVDSEGYAITEGLDLEGAEYKGMTFSYSAFYTKERGCRLEIIVDGGVPRGVEWNCENEQINIGNDKVNAVNGDVKIPSIIFKSNKRKDKDPTLVLSFTYHIKCINGYNESWSLTGSIISENGEDLSEIASFSSHLKEGRIQKVGGNMIFKLKKNIDQLQEQVNFECRYVKK
jgi:hypothetical protein